MEINQTAWRMRKNGREITDNQIVVRERRISEWRRVPGNNLLDATRQAFDEIAFPPRRVNIVKNVGSVLFDLRFQDVVERGTRTQAVLPGPTSLNFSVVAVGEKRPFITSIDR